MIVSLGQCVNKMILGRLTSLSRDHEWCKNSKRRQELTSNDKISEFDLLNNVNIFLDNVSYWGKSIYIYFFLNFCTT